MIVFGGEDDDGAILGDVWSLSLAGSPAWSELTPAGESPGPRENVGTIYDPIRDRMVIFSGYGGSNHRNDVWALSLSGAPAWSQLFPAGPAPAAQAGHSAIYDPVRDRMVVFGGSTWNPEIGYTGLTNGVWALSLSGLPTWENITPSGPSITPRGSHTAIYDPVRDRMIVYAGFGDGFFAQYSDASLNDAWAFDLAADSSQTTATLASLVSVDASADRIRLVWYMAGGAGAGVTLYRREAATEWMAIGSLTPDGTGYLRYEDDAVIPGAQYGYRLGIREGGAEVFAGETWAAATPAGVCAARGATEPIGSRNAFGCVRAADK